MPGQPLPRLERLLVTRPEPEASRWVADLKAHAWPAFALPLIKIAEPEGAGTLAALRYWRTHWDHMDAVFFVSGAAVVHFFRGVPPWAATDLPSTRFWAPGPGTARALYRCLEERGLSALATDTPAPDAGQFDSEALWPLVSAQVGMGRRILLVRGASEDPVSAAGAEAPVPPSWPGTGRDWLLQQCVQAGAEVDVCVAYRRLAPRWTPEQQQRALESLTAHSAWLFSSSEAVRHWRDCMPAQAQAPFAAMAVTTHQRIAEQAHGLGFSRVVTVRPTLSDLLGSLESVWSSSPV